MDCDINALIRRSSVCRKFNKREIPEDILKDILDAGIWGLSVLGLQPWRFVCVKNKKVIDQIADITSKRADDFASIATRIMSISATAIKTSSALIAIFNNGILQKRASKYGDIYVQRAYMAELQSIGGAIQNMFLTANIHGLAALWLDAPTFCEDDINKLLRTNEPLIAFLALGYPAMSHSRRSKRSGSIKYIN